MGGRILGGDSIHILQSIILELSKEALFSVQKLEKKSYTDTDRYAPITCAPLVVEYGTAHALHTISMRAMRHGETHDDSPQKQARKAVERGDDDF